MSKFQNEGFLFMNLEATETFRKSEVLDVKMNIVCPGVIVPLLPTQEKHREPEDDTLDFLSAESYIADIKQYCQIIKGKKLRIYWEPVAEVFMISSENAIYFQNENENIYDLSTVNFDLLNKAKCYYCITHPKKGIVLTNVVDKLEPDLATSYNLVEELAFQHYIVYQQVEPAMVQELLAKLESCKYGLLFILKDGRQLEFRNVRYNYHCMLDMPVCANMSIYKYFIMCLNKYATGATVTEYFKNLHADVFEFVTAYPEYRNKCIKITGKLMHLINNLREDTNDIDLDVIKSFVGTDPDTLLQLLCACP
jgi:hypothetical protein